jgi:acetylglutamate kinase
VTNAAREQPSAAAARPVVVKLGGELLEGRDGLARLVPAIAAMPHPLVIVHGGGREIDAALAQAGLPKRQVDGLRITDAATLEVVVSVLAGAVNTRFVAALTAAGVPAIGLTGADGRSGLSDVAPPHRSTSGESIDLGRVGLPRTDADVRALSTLTGHGFVPVIASIGIDPDGGLLNVNADTFAGHLACRLGASRLIIAGTTAGVLDDQGRTIAVLEPAAVHQLISSGTATAGMIAKLLACEHALTGGVGDVLIVNGRETAALEAAARGAIPAHSTRLVQAVAAPAS